MLESNCSTHSERLCIFCEKCRELICLKCLKNHSDHNTFEYRDYIETVVSCQQQPLLYRLNKLNESLSKEKEILTEDHDVRVEQQYHRQLEIIGAKFKELRDQLNKKEESLKAELLNHYQNNDSMFLKRMREIEENAVAVGDSLKALGNIDIAKTTSSNEEYMRCIGQLEKSMVTLETQSVNIDSHLNYKQYQLDHGPDETRVEDYQLVDFSDLKQYKESIKQDPLNYYPYFKLGDIMPVSSVIHKMTPEEHLVKSIDINPLHYLSYYSLAKLMDEKEMATVMLLNGTQMDQKALYLKSIELNPSFPYPYFCLALLMDNAKDTIKLFNDREMNQLQLLIESIELNPKDGDVYLKLLEIITNEEEQIIYNGSPAKRKDLENQYAKILNRKIEKLKLSQ